MTSEESMRRWPTSWPIVALAGALSFSAGALAGGQLSDQEKELFLLKAKVIERHEVSTGITGTIRLTLKDGALTHDAHLQTIDVYKARARLGDRTEMNFRDSYRFNIAAYKLDRMLKLNMVPVSVARRVGGKTGAVTWWVDNVLMMEKERSEKKIQPPSPQEWREHWQHVQVFTELVCNTDPNTGNMLITKDWKLLMVDFSRSFRETKDLREPRRLFRIGRVLYNGLKSLEEKSLRSELKSCLRKGEIKAILARRERIVQHFDELIAKRGEALVIRE